MFFLRIHSSVIVAKVRFNKAIRNDREDARQRRGGSSPDGQACVVDEVLVEMV